MTLDQDKTKSAESKCVGCLPDLKAHLIFWPVVAAGIFLDLWSKSAVFQWLIEKPWNEYVLIDGFLKFVMRENDGAAFSIASGHRIPLIVVSVVAFFVVIGIFLFGKIQPRLVQFALALFTAGIVGNLYDRMFNDGRVRDFIDVYLKDWHWPAFNAADSMLCIAVGLLIISNLKAAASQRQTHPHTEQHQGQPPEQSHLKDENPLP